jgi:hypothetical protein
MIVKTKLLQETELRRVVTDACHGAEKVDFVRPSFPQVERDTWEVTITGYITDDPTKALPELEFFQEQIKLLREHRIEEQNTKYLL